MGSKVATKDLVRTTVGHSLDAGIRRVAPPAQVIYGVPRHAPDRAN